MSMSLGNRKSQHSFAKVPSMNRARSAFDRSYKRLDTCNFDYLNPFFLQEILPGDTMNLNVDCFFRLAPQVRPLMDNATIDFFFFYAPNRILWENFVRQMGQQDNPTDSIDYLTPVIESPAVTGFEVGSIYDKFGRIQLGVPGIEICAYPGRMYNQIYNYWFRDQNLDNSLIAPIDDGPDLDGDYQLRLSNKKHDYFTAALKSPQKGAAVVMPLGETAPVITNDQAVLIKGSPVGIDRNALLEPANVLGYSGAGVGASENMYFGTETGLVTDLADATAASINLFRQAIQMQSFLERDNRGGTRYPEFVFSHFGVTVPDFRVQYPEFLSSTSIPLNQHVVAQNSASTEDSPQGNLSAFSTAGDTSNRIGFSKTFVEHGWVMGLMRVRGDLTYQEGTDRKYTRQTRFDYFFPEFQEIGDQAILNKEVVQSGFPIDDEPWAYQERNGEYRYAPSEICGQFKSQFAESLDVWHLAEDFGSLLPAFGSSFMKSQTPIERVLTVPDPGYPDLLCEYWFKLRHVRPMVSYPTPASLGRF